MKFKKKFILFCLILLIIPVVYASNYSSGNYGDDVYGGAGSGFVIHESPHRGSGGGGGYNGPECSLDSDCGLGQYCINNTCHDLECIDDSFCSSDETCWNFKCIKLFDVEIIDFSSPVKLGSHFEFTYSIYGRANINRDVEVNFWIEKERVKMTSGKDTIYVGSFEKVTKTSKLFLPSEINSGNYVLHIEIVFDDYSVESHRIMEIVVEEDVAEIELKPEINTTIIYIICFLIGLGFFILHLITYLKSKKERKREREENRAHLLHYLKNKNCTL